MIQSENLQAITHYYDFIQIVADNTFNPSFAEWTQNLRHGQSPEDYKRLEELSKKIWIEHYHIRGRLLIEKEAICYTYLVANKIFEEAFEKNSFKLVNDLRQKLNESPPVSYSNRKYFFRITLPQKVAKIIDHFFVKTLIVGTASILMGINLIFTYQLSKILPQKTLKLIPSNWIEWIKNNPTKAELIKFKIARGLVLTILVVLVLKVFSYKYKMIKKFIPSFTWKQVGYLMKSFKEPPNIVDLFCNRILVVLKEVKKFCDYLAILCNQISQRNLIDYNQQIKVSYQEMWKTAIQETISNQK